MKLSDLFESKVKIPKFLYHLTTVKAILDILKNKRFKLSKDTSSEDYFMSFARSGKSGYFTLMAFGDSAMMIFDGKEIYSNFKISPFDHEDGKKQLNVLGIHASEYEERMVSNKQYETLPNLHMIKEIRILRTSERSNGEAYYTDDELADLRKLCESNHISFKLVSTKQELRRNMT